MKVKEKEKNICHENMNQTKEEGALFKWNKVDIRAKKIARDGETEETSLKEKSANPLRNYSNSNNIILKCINQKLTELKGEIDKSKIIVRNYNIHLTTFYRKKENWLGQYLKHNQVILHMNRLQKKIH